MSFSQTRFPNASEIDDQGTDIRIHLPTNKPPLSGTVVHIGWLIPQHDSSYVLEKGFRALRTWFDSARCWQYDPEAIIANLRLQSPGCALRVYWFEDLEGDPWVARDIPAIVGAVERMRSRGREVCLFVAWDFEMVRGLRREWRALERQREQTLHLGFWNYDAWDLHDGQ
jgi:hypothetical protein